MTDAAKPATDESEDESQDESENESQGESVDESATEVPNRLSEKDAVAECLRAWRITMENERAELDEDENEYDAEKKPIKHSSPPCLLFPATRTSATSSPASPRLTYAT
jgi:hypothetical protein